MIEKLFPFVIAVDDLKALDPGDFDRVWTAVGVLIRAKYGINSGIKSAPNDEPLMHAVMDVSPAEDEIISTEARTEMKATRLKSLYRKPVGSVSKPEALWKKIERIIDGKPMAVGAIADELVAQGIIAERKRPVERIYQATLNERKERFKKLRPGVIAPIAWTEAPSSTPEAPSSTTEAATTLTVPTAGVKRFDYSNETHEIVDPATCVHYWRIDSPNGPTSDGVCKKCGTKQEGLRNSLPDTFNGESEESARARGIRRMQASARARGLAVVNGR